MKKNHICDKLFKLLDNPKKTPLWSVVFKSPLNHTKSGLIVSPIRAETKADAIKLFYKDKPHLKGKGEIVSVTQGTPPSVKRTDLVQKRPKIGDDIVSKTKGKKVGFINAFEVKNRTQDELKTFKFILLMKFPNEVRNSEIEFKTNSVSEARQSLKGYFNRFGNYKITKFTNDKLYLKGSGGDFIDITYSIRK